MSHAGSGKDLVGVIPGAGVTGAHEQPYMGARNKSESFVRAGRDLNQQAISPGPMFYDFYPFIKTAMHRILAAT